MRATFLAAVAVVLGAVAALVVSQRPLQGGELHIHGKLTDQAGYITTARQLLDTGQLRSGLVVPARVREPDWRPYMPGSYVALALAYRWFGVDDTTSLLPARVAFVLVCLCVLLLGRRLAGLGVGLLAAFLTATFPPLLQYAHTAMAELPLAAAGAIALTVFLHLRVRWRVLATPLLLLLPFAFRETGALLVLPMFFLLLFEARPDARRRALLAAALAVIVLVAFNAWQAADGKGGLPLDWVLTGRSNYADAFPAVPDSGPLVLLRGVARNLVRNVGSFAEQAWLAPWRLRTIAYLALLAVAGLATRRGLVRRDGNALGLACASFALTALTFGLYDVKSEKALRGILFLAPLLSVVAAAQLLGWLRRSLGARARAAVLVVMGVAVLAWSRAAAWNAGDRLRAVCAGIDAVTDGLGALNAPRDALFVAEPSVSLQWAVRHYPARWSFLPANDETLALLDEVHGVGLVVLPANQLEKRLTTPGLEALGLRRRRSELLTATEHYVVYRRTRRARRDAAGD